MRTLTTLALVLSLASTAIAKPHRKPAHRVKDSAWMTTCIHERTGPDGGVSRKEARDICLAEQPDDEVAAAKQQLAEARAAAKLAKAKERVAKAIEACEQAVVDGCVAAAPPDGSANCEDADLKVAFQVCH